MRTPAIGFNVTSPSSTAVAYIADSAARSIPELGRRRSLAAQLPVQAPHVDRLDLGQLPGAPTPSASSPIARRYRLREVSDSPRAVRPA